uniref:Uncharacterized protein n=1 Tax=Romanomermis culicivorax TaxID=13658 RepID=A0A915K409_ROMCU
MSKTETAEKLTNIGTLSNGHEQEKIFNDSSTFFLLFSLSSVARGTAEKETIIKSSFLLV